MKSILELLNSWCEQNNVTATKDSQRIMFSVTAENGIFSTAALPIEKERILIYLCGINIFVPENKRVEVSEELITLNYTLKWGSFQLDLQTGEITFRTSQLLPNDDVHSFEIIEKTIILTVQIMNANVNNIIKWVTE